MNIPILSFKKISTTIFLLTVGLMSTLLYGQLSPSGQSNIIVPNTLSGCARDTITIELTSLTGPTCVPTSGAPTVRYDITIPGGTEINYLAGSLSSNATFFTYVGKILSFTTDLPSFGVTKKIKFVVASTCNVTSVTPMPFFAVTATYPSGVTPSNETWNSTKMNVGVGQITLYRHCAWHAVLDQTACNQKTWTGIVAFKQDLGDYIDITNSGFGAIQDLEYNILLDDSLYYFYNPGGINGTNTPVNTNQFAYYYHWNNFAQTSCGLNACDRWLGTGVGGGSGYTADVTTGTIGGKRWYKFSFKNFLLGSNGLFDPNEVIRLPLYLRAPSTCVGDQVIKRWVTYKCATGAAACQATDTFTTIYKITAGRPIIAVQNKQVQAWDGCAKKTASFTFVNNGTPVIPSRPEVSRAYDLNLSVALAGKLNIENLTFAGVTTVPTIESFPGVANNITWKIKDQLTFDPDGPGGLFDGDGDGFYDELNVGDSIKVSFTYTVPCGGVACGADLYYNIMGNSTFTDYCRKLNGTGGVSIYEFGFKQVAPTAQVTPLPDFGTLGKSALQTRTGTFNLNYKQINLNTSGATAKLRINYSKTMMVVEPISFLGVSRTLSAFTAIGTGDVTPVTSTAAGYADTTNKRTDNDSALEYTLTAAEVATLLDGTADQLSYSLTHIACDSFQKQRNVDNFQILFTMGTTCSTPPQPCALDLVCKKSFGYQVSEGCGNFPCYRSRDTLFRYGRTGFTNENETTPQAATAGGTSKFYPGDTFINRSTSILSANIPNMETTGSNALRTFGGAVSWLSNGFRTYFSMSFDKPVGLAMEDLTPHHYFIPNLSKIKIYDTTGPGRTLLYTIPLNFTHFYNWNGDVSTENWNRLEFGDESTDAYSGVTNTNSAPGLGLGDYYCFHSSQEVDYTKCPFKDTRWRDIGSNVYQVMRNEADNRVSEFYHLMLEKAMADAGVSFNPGFTKYEWEVDIAWRINPDYPQQNLGQFLIKRYGLYRGGNQQSLPYEGRTLVGTCALTQTAGTAVSNDLLVEGAGATYSAACGLNVCNKLFFKSATGDYFPSPEVRVPYKLSKIEVILPAEYHTTAAPTLSGSNGGPSNGLNVSGTASGGGLTGLLTFTNNTGVTGTSYTDFPRISDADGGLTAWSVCYPVSNAGTDNFITQSYKIPAKYYLEDEDGKTYILIDTFNITESNPKITLAPLGGSATVDDGMSCTPSFMDILVSNNTIYAASNAWITAMGNSNVTLLGFTDMGGDPDVDPITTPADTNQFMRYGFNNIYAELGGMKAGGRRIVRVWFNTTQCNGSIKLITNFGCNYPASRSPEYPSPTIDSSTITFTANPPKVMAGAINGNKNIANLCDQQVLEVEIRNVANPNLKNILAGVKLPANTTYVAGSAQIAYPKNVWVTAPTVTVQSADSFTINVSSDVNLANACGLLGLDEAFKDAPLDVNSVQHKNIVKVRFTVDFNACPTGTSSPVFVGVQAENYCGTKTSTKIVFNLIYTGTTTAAANYTCKPQPNSQIAMCAKKGETVRVLDKMRVFNLSGGASAVGDTMEITIGQDTTRFKLSNFTISSPWSAPVVIVKPDGKIILRLAVPTGLAVGDSINVPLEYNLTSKVDNVCNNPSATCADISHITSFYSVPTLVCAAKGLSCPVAGRITKGQGSVNRDLQCCASLGDYVWLDDDKDGIQDANEQPVAGITVTLYDATGKAIASTVTDAYGKYMFTDLIPGQYSVGFTPTTNYDITPVQTTGTANGSDANPATGRTPLVTLAEGENNPNIDCGLIQAQPTTQNIGDFVWFDKDKDGIQDAGEPGIAGVTVTLYDNAGKVIGTTVTDQNGKYLFPNVPPGTYTVGFTPPIGMVGSPQTTGTANGSDMSPTTFKTAPFTVVSGTDRLDIDAGFYPQADNKCALGNLVWNDLNANGIQDAGEPGVDGVTVELRNSSGTVIATTKTDAYGNYVFNDLAPGTYSVKFSNLPSGYVFSPANQGGAAADSTDSDAATGTGITGNYTLAAGERNMSVDAGINKPGANFTLGNYVWLDADKDGVQDANEAGIAGVMIILRDASGNPLDTTYTDKDGKYLFTNLPAGTYSVQAKNWPQGLSISPKDATADAADSDADASGVTSTVTLSAGNPNDMTLDIGLMPSPQANYTGTLGNKVWFDGDADGIQDAGEPGLPNVKVYLYNAAGAIIDSTVTDAKGEYLFTGLNAGTYTVGIKMPTGYNVSAAGVGTDPAIDNNGNTPVAGISKSNPIALGQGEDNLTVDFGINKPGALIVGNKVWLDANKDGYQDPSESGVPGIGVKLMDKFGNVVATTITDENGNYLFVDVPAGDYQIQFTNLPTGYVFTAKDTSLATDLSDSDPNKATGKTDVFTVVGSGAGAYTWTTDNTKPQLSYDAGIYPATTAAVKGTYWSDANGDGIQDPTEKGIPGMRVTLYDNAGNPVASAITDANGNYLFPNVTPGNGYTIGFEAPPAGSEMTQQNGPGTIAGASNSDANPTTRKTAPFNLAAGQIQPDVDAGVRTQLLGSLGDKIWLDRDMDGQQDAGEPGVPGVILELLDASGNVIASTVTDGNGNYLFSNLPAGNYKVRMASIPPGLQVTHQDLGADATDNDFAQFSKTTGSISLAAGENKRDIDGGLVPQSFAKLGSYVWFDQNIDGVAGTSEPVVVGAKVYLIDDFTGKIIDSTVTGSDGKYLFDSLIPGDYRVKFSYPGYKPTYSNIWGNLRDSFDSDADEITGISTKYTLSASNSQNMTVWAGLVPNAQPLSYLASKLTASLSGAIVTYKWSRIADESVVNNYSVIRRFNNGNWAEINKTLPSGLDIYKGLDNLSQLGAGKYSYQVVITHATGEVRTNIALVDYLKASNRSVVLMPNPTSDNYQIVLNGWDAASTTITMIGMDGKVVKTINTTGNSVTVNTQGLTAGSYIVRISQNGITATEKLVIAR